MSVFDTETTAVELAPAPGMVAVVCDDDPVVRAVVRTVIEQRTGEVIAETGHAATAIELVERYRPDVVVVDLALQSGSGVDVARTLSERADPPAVIVFTAFDGMVGEGSGLQIVRKPSFDDLERALDEVVQVAVRRDERRRAGRVVPPAGPRDETGIDGRDDFYRVLVEAGPEEVLLVVPVEGLDPAETAAAMRGVLRSQDRMTRRHDVLVALLIGAGPDGAASVTARLAAAIPGIDDRVRSGLTGDSPAEAFMDLTS